jgi:NADH-quinone oxidoreductase subunit E
MYNELFANYNQGDRSSLIPVLQDVQEKYGYLPEKDLADVSKYLNMPLSTIYGVATFYNQFRLTPLGKNVIRVCRGTACHVKSSANILLALETELKIKAGETTRDKLFTIETVACIGACSIAPVISVNDEYYGRLVVKEIPKIINKYKRESRIRVEKETENVED